MFLFIFFQNVLSICESAVLKSPPIIMLQLMCGFICSSCFMELCGRMLGAWSSLALFAVGEKKLTKTSWREERVYFRRSLEVRTETEAMEECCFLACFLLLAESAFVYFPRPRKDINKHSIFKVIHKSLLFVFKINTQSRNMNTSKTRKIWIMDYLKLNDHI